MLYEVYFSPVKLERRSNRFYVELDMLFNCGHINGDACLAVTPMLVKTSPCLELPSVMIAGRSRYRAFRFYLRSVEQSKSILSCYKIQKIINAVHQEPDCYSYRTYMDYEDWMEDATISLFLA